MMRWTLAAVALLLASGELAAQGKGMRFWNLTTATISSLQLSPAGKDTWGPNQTLNDKDKEVDHDERLRITSVEPGRYERPRCAYRKSNPGILVMQSAQNRMGDNVSDPPDDARDRRIVVQ